MNLTIGNMTLYFAIHACFTTISDFHLSELQAIM